MLRLDKKNKEYIWVEISDIIKGYLNAQKAGNDIMAKKLQYLFSSDQSTSVENAKIKLKISDPVIEFLKSIPFIEVWDLKIDDESIKEALSRSVVEYNHQMKKQLEKYQRKFHEYKILGRDVTPLVYEIKENSKLLNYIKKYETYSEYQEEHIKKDNKRITTNEELEFQYKKTKDKYAA